MDEQTFAAAVGDWLRATDTRLPDADANVHAAVARAGDTRQSARRRWAALSVRRTGALDRREGGRSLLLPLLAALAVLLVIGSAAFALLLQEADRRLAEPIAASGPDGMSWQTGRVDLRADAFRLEADGRTFTMVDTPLRIESDEDALSMVVSWSDDGSELAVSMRFGYLANDVEGGTASWWLAEAAADIDGQVSRSAGPFLRTPIGETYRGDVELELGSGTSDVRLAFDDLSVAVQPPPEPPWWRGAAVLGIPIPDVIGDIIGPLLPDPADSEPTPEALRDPVRASILVGEVVFSGKLRGDGVFIVTKNPGHRAEGVIDVAVGPGGTVWVAMRDGAVYRLGELGSIVTASDAGPAELTRIEALVDGSLLGYSGAAAWRLADGYWSQLPASGEAGAATYDTVPEALERLGGSSPSDFVVGGITPDGTIWGHGVSSKRVQAILPDAQRPPRPVDSSAVVDPALATFVGGLAVTGERLEQGVIRLTGADGRVIVGVKDVIVDGHGEVWVARHRELFVPGRPERFGAADGGPDWIDRLALDAQGALVVSGDGYWRFRDGRWTDLSTPVRGLGTVDWLGRQTIDGYIVAGVDGDGRLWGIGGEDAPAEWQDDGDGRLWGVDGKDALAYWNHDGWVPDELPAISPPRWPGDSQGTSYWQASIDAGGDAWVQLSQNRLVHFDGTRWSELDLDLAAVTGDPDADLVGFLPTRDSTAWLLAVTDTAGDDGGELDRVVRYADGSFTPYLIDEIIEPLGLAGWQLADTPSVARDGHSVIIPILGADGEVDVAFDGTRATVLGPLPRDFTWRATAEDGSVWGIGPDGTLLVLPASETDG